MNFQELSGSTYLVLFDENELSLKQCGDLFRHLRAQCPDKTFIGMMSGVELKELSDKEIDNLLSILTEIKQFRAEK